VDPRSPEARQWFLDALERYEALAKSVGGTTQEHAIRGQMAGLVRAAVRFGVVDSDELAGITARLRDVQAAPRRGTSGEARREA
jgi:hypothetical protein